MFVLYRRSAMRYLLIYLSALSSLHTGVAIRHGSSPLRDLQAFPKYEVQFLNHLPLASSDAERCQSLGLDREEDWLGHRPGRHDRRRVGDGSDNSEIGFDDPRLELIRMALNHPSSNETHPYLCLMPSKETTALQDAQAEVQPVHEEIDPVLSWSALSHLDGKCLYAKQGWFTYAYCHNSHLRQFRAAPHAHPHPPGGYIPEEDTTYDAYTLGQAHSSSSRKARSSLPQGRNAPGKGRGRAQAQTAAGKGSSVDRTNSDHTPRPAVSASSTGSSRYLVQKWSDGTRCDKSGRPRETEVQIHCSMTTNDQIYLIKELAICQYVLIIHSPHLCSLPGFRPERVDVDAAPIQCRQVMPDAEFEAWRRGSDAGERGEVSDKTQGIEASRRPEGMGTEEQVEENALAVEGPSLKDLLKQAFEKKQGQDQGDADAAEGRGASQKHQPGDDFGAKDGEVVFIALEDHEDGNAAMVLDSEALLASLLSRTGSRDEARAAPQNQGARSAGLGEDDRAMILKAVKQFLETRQDSRKGEGQDDNEEPEKGRKRDEL